MTERTLLQVDVATPFKVSVGWHEGSKLRWTVSAEFDVQKNGGEMPFEPGWLRFTRYVDGSECRGTQRRGQGGDDGQTFETLVLRLPNHDVQIDGADFSVKPAAGQILLSTPRCRVKKKIVVSSLSDCDGNLSDDNTAPWRRRASRKSEDTDRVGCVSGFAAGRSV